jgi:hypothetical protein
VASKFYRIKTAEGIKKAVEKMRAQPVIHHGDAKALADRAESLWVAAVAAAGVDRKSDDLFNAFKSAERLMD